MGEFLAQYAAHKLASGGSGPKTPDQSQPTDPAAMLASAMPQPQPGFSGAVDPSQQNAMAHPASSFMDTLAKMQSAPHDWAQGMKTSAMDALAKMFT